MPEVEADQCPHCYEHGLDPGATRCLHCGLDINQQSTGEGLAGFAVKFLGSWRVLVALFIINLVILLIKALRVLYLELAPPP